MYRDTGDIFVGFPSTFSISEGDDGQDLQSSLLFNISGTSEDEVIFSLVPLTYQQFENITGQSVTSLFSSVPSPASEGTLNRIKVTT